ncbi:aspartic peptidase [Salix suchowensis]|nr:aspartic peptidase [Salix suchowensis]
MGIMSATLASDGQSVRVSVCEDARVGGMNFRVALDTASSDLWLASSACTTETCNAIPRYPLSYESPSFASVNGNQTAFNASYADGTSSNGFIARERVTLANLTIPDQTLGIITVSNVTLTDRTTGLLGLGFPRLSGVIKPSRTVGDCYVSQLRGPPDTPAATPFLPANISWNPVVQFTPFASESNVSSYLQWAIPLGGFSRCGYDYNRMSISSARCWQPESLSELANGGSPELRRHRLANWYGTLNSLIQPA